MGNIKDYNNGKELRCRRCETTLNIDLDGCRGLVFKVCNPCMTAGGLE